MINCKQIVAFMDEKFARSQYPDEMPALWQDTERAISRIGLALEPWPQITKWIVENKLDALFLHRPWNMIKRSIPLDIGIIAYHLPFDEHLTVGYNVQLAADMGALSTECFGTIVNRPLGMIITIKDQSKNYICKHIENAFGGVEETLHISESFVNKVAFVNAINENLVNEAAHEGVQMYITGQLRKPAKKAILVTEMAVVAIGHKRIEYYGLKLLKRMLLHKWPELVIYIQP